MLRLAVDLAFIWFWAATLGDAAVSPVWYWRRAMVVVTYLPLLLFSHEPGSGNGVTALAESMAIVHVLCMTLHFLTGDKRMWGDDGI